MKKFYLIALFLLNTGFVFCGTDDTLKVMTFNIRCQNGESEDDINYWSGRKYLVAELIDKYSPDIIGMQEAEKRQIDDLEVLLDGYKRFGVGRENGKEEGEYSVIFYDSSKFSVQWDSTIWLSPTPTKPSIGWDAMFKRIVTFGLFQTKADGNEFYFFNTHFDHKGDTARIESAKLLVKKVSEVPVYYPVLVTGDFNSTSSSEPYKIITETKSSNDFPLLSDAQFISAMPHFGGDNSFNGFGKTEEPDRIIDFIFVNDKVEVTSQGIITDTYNGLYPSDHFPVQAVIVIGN